MRRPGSRVRSIARASDVMRAIGRIARRATARPASRARAVPPSTPKSSRKRTRSTVWRRSDSGRAYWATAKPARRPSIVTGTSRDSTRWPLISSGALRGKPRSGLAGPHSRVPAGSETLTTARSARA